MKQFVKVMLSNISKIYEDRTIIYYFFYPLYFTAIMVVLVCYFILAFCP